MDTIPLDGVEGRGRQLRPLLGLHSEEKLRLRLRYRGRSILLDPGVAAARRGALVFQISWFLGAASAWLQREPLLRGFQLPRHAGGDAPPPDAAPQRREIS